MVVALDGKTNSGQRVLASGTRMVRRAALGRWALIVCIAVFVAGAARTIRITSLWQWNFEDLAVYTRGASAVLHGTDPYANHAGQLAFTYPPFAALAILPLHAIGAGRAQILMAALSLLCAVLVTVTLGRRLALRARTTALLGLVCLSIEPVLRTLQLGQVNLLLTALVVLDAFVIPSRTRGLLTGVAAGIKLVPGVFVIYYALRRDWPAVARCSVGFVASVAMGAIATPSGSWHYWTRSAFSTTHIGSPTFVDNQSLTGVSGRLLRTEHPPTSITLLLGAVALLLAAAAARVQLQRDNQAGDVAALTCIAIGGLLASPIAWTHHWVWLAPVVLVLVSQRRHLAASGTFAIAYVAPEWYTPNYGNRELHDNLWQQLLGASFALLAIAFLVIMCSSHLGAGGSNEVGSDV